MLFGLVNFIDHLVKIIYHYSCNPFEALFFEKVKSYINCVEFDKVHCAYIVQLCHKIVSSTLMFVILYKACLKLRIFLLSMYFANQPKYKGPSALIICGRYFTTKHLKL